MDRTRERRVGGVYGEHDGPFLRARLRYDGRFRLEVEQARAYGVPHSVFTGRVVEPGAPPFLPEDTDAAVALAEEERDTCPSCGYPKVWCRNPANQFGVFKAHEEQCHVTYALAARRAEVAEGRDEVARAAVQISARFRDGYRPDYTAGLDLPEGSLISDEPA